MLGVCDQQKSSAEPASQPGVVVVEPAQQLHEKATIAQLPAPPTAPSMEAGSCTAAVNPRGTGCVSPEWGALGSVGTYWPGNQLEFNPAGMIGELRGWTSDGSAVVGLQVYQSNSLDAWATDNATGQSRS